MTGKILYVDDDPNILAACARSLGRSLALTTATSGAAGLEILRAEGPFAVVLSDMRMPGMDGVEFLCAVRRHAPDTVCIMLTGNSDQETAMNAVNKGRIFRFLTKPCAPEDLRDALDAGLRQHRLITAEKELLSNTLLGSVRALADVLSLVNPMAFACGTRIKPIVKAISQNMGLAHAWQFDLAALLSQIGCVVLPPAVIEKVYAGRRLTEEEAEMYASHPKNGSRLIEHIPRLEPCAKMIEGQLTRFDEMTPSVQGPQVDDVTIGSQILHVTLDIDALISRSMPKHTAVLRLKERRGEYNPELLDLIDQITLPGVDDAQHRTKMELSIWKLKPGMIVDEAIETSSGTLLVPKGVEITLPIIQRLRNFASGAGVKEPIHVLVNSPAGAHADRRARRAPEAA